MIHSPLTEKGSASKRDFLRNNLSIISHHSSIWNFFSYRKQIALIFFCRMSPNRHSCLESFFFLQTPFKQAASCSPSAWVCVFAFCPVSFSLFPLLFSSPPLLFLSHFPSSSAHSEHSSLEIPASGPQSPSLMFSVPPITLHLTIWSASLRASAVCTTCNFHCHTVFSGNPRKSESNIQRDIRRCIGSECIH